MNHLVVVSSILILTITTINAGPADGPPHMHSLANLCKDLQDSIADGNFITRKKILDDCASQSFTNEQRNAMDSCRAKLLLETPEDVKKVCADMKTYEPKFQEVKDCFKSNTPGPSSKKTFKDCLFKALGKN